MDSDQNISALDADSSLITYRTKFDVEKILQEL